MKKQLCIISCLFLFACNNPNKESVQQKQTDSAKTIITKSGTTPMQSDTSRVERDSITFLKLIISTLKWDKDDTNGSVRDFRLMQKNPTDSFFSGIDWKNYDLRAKELNKTGLFSKEFMDNYHNIAVSIDSKIKQSKTKCLVGMQSYQDFDELCNCQYIPDNLEKLVIITNIKDYEDSATFQWMWDSLVEKEKDKYTVKTKKENGTWKISYLDSFTDKIFTPDF